jgi:hypothetical protein
MYADWGELCGLISDEPFALAVWLSRIKPTGPGKLPMTAGCARFVSSQMSRQQRHASAVPRRQYATASCSFLPSSQVSRQWARMFWMASNSAPAQQKTFRPVGIEIH